MKIISAQQHLRSMEKINKLCQELERAGLSFEELIQKRNELQKLYDTHHQLMANLDIHSYNYFKHFKILRQNYQLQRRKLKIRDSI